MAMTMIMATTMVMAQSTEDLNNYFSLTQYGKANPTVYYENYGPLRIVGGHYKIVTFLSLEEYNTKFISLGERIQNLTINCDLGLMKKMICAKYQDVLLHMYSEVTDQRDKLFLSLGKNQITDSGEEGELKRSKRGLMNFVGKGAHYLFGVCDDDCTQNANNVIAETEKNGKNIMHIMKQQTTVVKASTYILILILPIIFNNCTNCVPIIFNNYTYCVQYKYIIFLPI